LSSRSSRSSEFGLASDGKQRGKKLPTPRDIINSLRCPVDGLISYNEQVQPLAACAKALCFRCESLRTALVLQVLVRCRASVALSTPT
jgi:hypothetical protein